MISSGGGSGAASKVAQFVIFGRLVVLFAVVMAVEAWLVVSDPASGAWKPLALSILALVLLLVARRVLGCQRVVFDGVSDTVAAWARRLRR